MQLLPGVTARRVDVDDADDLERAYVVSRECELAGVGHSDATRESVRAALTSPDAARDAHLMALEGEVPVGLLVVESFPSEREVYVDAYGVGPRAGDVVTALLGRAVALGESLAADDPGPGLPAGTDRFALDPRLWQVTSGAYEQDVAYREALRGHGFREIRRFWRMRKDLAGVSPSRPEAPQGATFRPAGGSDDRLALHRVFEESFADHFGHAAMPAHDWLARIEALPGSDAERWWLALLDGVPVGLCIQDDSRAEFGEGYVRTLGVVPSGRGRGIARWLLGCAAADAVSRGRHAIALAVDGQNTTGATALYQSVGYEARHVIDVWCRPVAVEQVGVTE
ncbi:MAG: GNAT family N-acetyltransferase [Actinomycetota bacterium]|nr:GNAT family N-acetyltransferase [Actinomycetota bacterium]